MRFVLAIISFVLAALMMGLGIGQRTFLAGPDEVTAATTKTTTSGQPTSTAPSPVVVIDGSALNAYERTQTVEISGAPKVVAAYARTADVLAWVGNATYTHVTYDAKTGELVSKVVAGDEAEVPQLSGSDLWLREYSGEDALRMRVDLADDSSIIAVSDGIAPAPADVSVTWPIDNSAPSSEPLVIGGAASLLLGLILLIWALVHMRRSRGPRRTPQKQPKMPKLPRQPRYKPGKPKAITVGKGRRATRPMVVALPLVLASAIVLSGCSSDPFAGFTGEAVATPTPTASEDTEADLPVPPVTEAQVTRIVSEIGTVAAKADTDLNKDLIATRLAGPALELRLANYKVRAVDAATPSVEAIRTGPVKLILPQQGDAWPRTVFAVIQDPAEATVAPLALMLIQEDARSNYKVNYAVTLEPKLVLDNLAASSVGAAKLSSESKLLQLPPAELAAAYGDILMTDTASPSNDLFQVEGDSLRTKVGLAAKNAFVAALPTTAKAAYTDTPGPGRVVALSTTDSGAIVAVQVNETLTVTPVKEGASVKATGQVKALSGKESTTKGVSATYGLQLLFYVPSANEPGKAVLLGFSQGLIDAKELP